VTVTLHGNVSDPYIPIFGNKVIALRNGELSLIGPTRDVTWTQLDSTAEANSTTITLRKAVDWQVGETIVIASTDYEARHAEERVITAVDLTDADKPVLTLDRMLNFKHFAMT